MGKICISCDKEMIDRPHGYYCVDCTLETTRTRNSALSVMRSTSARECIECGDKVPAYSNYFCEPHLIDFLTKPSNQLDEFKKAKGSFTISHSQ